MKLAECKLAEWAAAFSTRETLEYVVVYVLILGQGTLLLRTVLARESDLLSLPRPATKHPFFPIG